MDPELTFYVVLKEDEEGWFTAKCLDLPGCISQGKTREEALENVKEAITGYLLDLKKHGERLEDVRVDVRDIKAADLFTDFPGPEDIGYFHTVSIGKVKVYA